MQSNELKCICVRNRRVERIMMQFDARSLSVHTKATNSNSKPHKHTQNGNNEPDNMNVEKI